MGGKPQLEVRNVTKRFGGLVALDAVSLSVNKGEIVGLIGPNGSGKTTLLNVIHGVYRPESGEIFFEGQKITGKKPYQICRMGIARTFQIPRPLPFMTAVDNVVTGVIFGKKRKFSIDEARLKAIETLKLVDFPLSRINHKARDFKVLELKLLEIARALATDPKLLLLDEPFAGLTPAEIDKAVKIVKEINNLGTTIIIIEHLLKVIMRLCQRVIVLNFGKKIAEGEPKAVVSDREVIRAYIGEEIVA